MPALVRKLGEYDHTKDWYLGKPSLPHPFELPDRADSGRPVKFWFATGGAGVCLSRALAERLLPVVGGGKFESEANRLRLPDDVTLGYLVEHVLGTALTVVDEFHSHLEPLRLVSGSHVKPLDEHLSFSYADYGKGMNVVLGEIEQGAPL